MSTDAPSESRSKDELPPPLGLAVGAADDDAIKSAAIGKGTARSSGATTGNRTTKLDRQGGKRPLKEYPFSEDNIEEIKRLAGTKPPSKMDFGIAAALTGFSLNVALGISFVSVKDTSYYVWLTLCGAAAVVSVFSWLRFWIELSHKDTSRTDIVALVQRIKDETKFN